MRFGCLLILVLSIDRLAHAWPPRPSDAGTMVMLAFFSTVYLIASSKWVARLEVWLNDTMRAERHKAWYGQ